MQNTNMFKYVHIINVLIWSTSAVKYSCRDENNKAVDWFYIYKLPKITEHENKLVTQGAAYAYITSNDQNGWKLSEKAITDVTSIPGLTLAPIYQPKFRSELLYILYNDQPPDMIHTPKNPGFYRDGAHAKGAVVGDKTGGFWMVHSVPRYAADPEKNDQHGYLKNGHLNGQSFLCITLKPKDLELAGRELWYNGIHVYAKSTPENLQKTYSKLYEVASEVNLDSQVQKEFLTQIVRKIRGKEVTRNHCGIITSAGGTQFKVFAKSEKYLKELYSDWVAPDLNVNLLVQTWPKGRSHETSTCGINQSVENILNIKVTDVEFSTVQDHSKWTISKTENNPWVCVGDINKDKSQKKRGGGTVCMKNKSVWQAYFKTVIDVEKCSK